MMTKQFLILWLGMASSATVYAQQTLEPVDQAVADLDQLSTSLRRVETGLRLDGEQTALYRFNDNPSGSTAYDSTQPPNLSPQSQPTYYRVSPGLTARLDRPIDYVQVGRSGRIAELVPPNTVFELGAPPPAEPLPATSHLPDYRIDLRIDGRLDTRISAQAASQTTPTTNQPNSPLSESLPSDSHRFNPSQSR